MVRASVVLFLKGMAMGAANVIPGVSGGTIAFVTKIYDELISSLKSFDFQALRYLIRLDIKSLINHTNFWFLAILISGALISLVTFGRALGYLMSLGQVYERYVWSFFFGLILASVYYIGKQIEDWKPRTIVCGVVGLVIAIGLAFLKPAQQNDSFIYLIICGIVAMSSMLLPGLSGSYVLILMGNYRLIMLEAIPNRNIRIVATVGLGAIVGFVILSRVISFLSDRFKNETMSALTGFILGSLILIWPWKNSIYLLDENGSFLIRKGEKIVSGYNWFLPSFDSMVLVSILLLTIGFMLVWLLENYGHNKAS